MWKDRIEAIRLNQYSAKARWRNTEAGGMAGSLKRRVLPLAPRSRQRARGRADSSRTPLPVLGLGRAPCHPHPVARRVERYRNVALVSAVCLHIDRLGLVHLAD